MESRKSDLIPVVAAAFCAGSLTTYFLLRGGYLQQRNALPPTVSLGNKQLTDDKPATDGDDFLQAGGALLQWIVDYRKSCRDLPVISQVPHNYLKDLLPPSAPSSPEPWGAILADLDSKIVPGLTHWEASNRFFAYFKPHSSYPAVLGEMLCAGLNVMGFDWIASPACTELEVVTLDWLGKILNLPDTFLSSAKGPGGGVIQGSAGESCIVVLLAAVLRQGQTGDGEPIARDRMVVYGSDQTHTIVKKACRVLGVRYHILPTRKVDDWSLQADVVEGAVEADKAAGLVPIAVVGTIGTTSSCAHDDIPAIAAVCKARGLWLHIDAAYGGAYLCLAEYKHLLSGLESVDSFCVNCHKKLLCPFDLAALYLADRGPVVQALSVDSEYLRNEHSESGAVNDFENWQLPLGRRFRALKLWFVLRRFGADGMRAHVRKGVQLRRVAEELIRADPRFEIAAKPSLSLVCFRLKGQGNEAQQRLLQGVKATGLCFIIHTKLGGEVVLRLACGGVEQCADDVRRAWAVISSIADGL